MIGFIGVGNMAKALISAIDAEIIGFDLDKEKLKGINGSDSNQEVVDNSEIIFLCVKPDKVNEVLETVNISEDKILISIAAGITINTLESFVSCKIIRIMPNINCLVHEMAGGFRINKKVTQADKKKIEELLSNAGILVEVDEGKLDAVTALSGSGPAFFAKFIQDMAESGREIGLDDGISRKLAVKTAQGTSKMLEKYSPQQLIDMVSSPGGTTVAGLEKFKIKDIIYDTLKAAKERSEELKK